MPFETVITEDSGCPVIVLRDKTTGCEAEIYAFGALLNAFRIPVNHQEINLIDGFASVQDAKENITNGFKSTKLSPFVCRMNKGSYVFENTSYQVQPNFSNGHAIHGLLYNAQFDIVNNNEPGAISLVTTYKEHQYKGFDPGYPFDFQIVIHWKLEPGNRLTATTTIMNQSQHTIPLADGWHPYFTLGGSVDEWTLQFDSNAQLEFDAELVPTGNKIKDERFTNGASLQGIVLDNAFELTPDTSNPKCVLQNEKLKLIIQPDKTYPILQVYIPPHRKSIAIENLSGAPDNFNNGMGLIRLAPGESRTFTTSYIAENIEY